MILVVDLCWRPGSLSSDEFVAPVERIVKGEHHPALARHYTQVTREDLAPAAGVILCGTALRDCGYLSSLEHFTWLPSFPRPVLGICAGMQVIAELSGGEVFPGVSIGMAGQEVLVPDPLFAGRKRFEAYELHSLAVESGPAFAVLATSPSGVTVMRHPDRPVYGLMFHPEVRNEWVIHRFLSLCGPGARIGDDLMPDEREPES
jgi:GMP synthase (glutamine-hydrolysing)